MQTPPLLGLAPDGGCLAVHITMNAGGLLHHLFTLTGTYVLAVCFCGPIRQVTPPRVLPDIALYGVRTFLDAVSSAAIAQPTWDVHHTIIEIERQSRIPERQGFHKKEKCGAMGG